MRPFTRSLDVQTGCCCAAFLGAHTRLCGEGRVRGKESKTPLLLPIFVEEPQTKIDVVSLGSVRHPARFGNVPGWRPLQIGCGGQREAEIYRRRFWLGDMPAQGARKCEAGQMLKSQPR